jgi:acetyl-CoA carboxylase carboxyl transferase subunit alpha
VGRALRLQAEYDTGAALKITAQDLLALKVIDGIVMEPVGGAHRAREATVQAVGEIIARALDEMHSLSRDELRNQRRAKYLDIGRNLG